MYLSSSSWSFCCCALSAAPLESALLPSERSQLCLEWTSAMHKGTLTGTYNQNKHMLIYSKPAPRLCGSESSASTSNSQRHAILPVNVIVFMHAVKLQLKATQQVLNHDPQVMIEDPGPKTG